MRGKIYDIAVFLHNFFFDERETVSAYIGIAALAVIVGALLVLVIGK